VQFTDLNNDVH